ncbi:hypothetical protein [Coleofasciculus chthonoplastes]|uniref:hypothetical protein n=1 Tax=Coleofasciculus chthonoplastes TaxID=64178 RepID=UPI0005C6D6C2|nr:hypothetical protein [Coleofasciculus chthonoplastes]
MTKWLISLASTSILGTLTFAAASHPIPAFNDLSTHQAIICANCKRVVLPTQKPLLFKPTGDLTLNSTTTNSNKEPRPSPHNFLTRSECRGSSRRQEKQDYSILDFRFWITEEACKVGNFYQDYYS